MLEPTYLICEFYKDAEGKFRWRLKSRNGRVLANCGESYTRYEDCTKAWFKMLGVMCGTTKVWVKYTWANVEAFWTVV